MTTIKHILYFRFYTFSKLHQYELAIYDLVSKGIYKFNSNLFCIYLGAFTYYPSHIAT